MDGAGTQVGADKMALEKVVELVMAPTGSKKTRSGGLVGLGGHSLALLWPRPALPIRARIARREGGKINPISRGGSRWPRHARLAKGRLTWKCFIHDSLIQLGEIPS